jgi:cell division protein ZapA (FtsZ GTPase activity inhibitor)
MQLWQYHKTNIYVGLIKVWMSGNRTENLVADQNLQNTEDKEILVLDRSINVSVTERQRLLIGVWYFIKDLDFGNAVAVGSNDLASVDVYPQTYDELASQASSLQNQVSNLQAQQLGFVFIAVYLIATLGVAVPLMQRQRKTGSDKANVEKKSDSPLIHNPQS